MAIDLGGVTEYTGWLSDSNDTIAVEVEKLKLDASSTKILAETLRLGAVSKGKQNLLIEEISINKGHLENFTIGQSALKKTSAGYSLSADHFKNPVRFRGVLSTNVLGVDKNYHKYQACIGCIEFDLNGVPETDGETALFSNVGAVIYPSGEYRAIPDDEE